MDVFYIPGFRHMEDNGERRRVEEQQAGKTVAHSNDCNVEPR